MFINTLNGALLNVDHIACIKQDSRTDNVVAKMGNKDVYTLFSTECADDKEIREAMFKISDSISTSGKHETIQLSQVLSGTRFH